MSRHQYSRIQYIYATIVLGFGIALVLSIATGAITPKEISIAALASIGTFLGALFAFRLNENKEISKELSEHRAALNRALFILARQRNAVDSFKKYLPPFKTDVERALLLPAHKPPTYEGLNQNFETLEFMLEYGKANLLMRLAIEDERFHQTFESIRIRNDFYVSEVQPELARHGLQGKDVTDKQLFDLLGERIFGSAITYSKMVYFHVSESEKSIPALHAEVHAAANEIFPESKFISFGTEA